MTDRQAPPQEAEGTAATASGSKTAQCAVPRRRWPAAAALLVVALVAAGGLWLRQSQQAAEAAAASARAALEQRVAVLAGKVQALEEEVRGLAGSRERSSARLAEIERSLQRLDELERAVSELFEREERGDRDWVLAEVEHLLTVASEHLALAGEVEVAVAALQSADRRLQTLGEPALTPLRERLVADVNALRAVAVPDYTRLALELGDHAARVALLPLAGDRAAAGEAQERAAQPPASGWQGALRRMWQDLVALVDVEPLAPSDAAALDPQVRRLIVAALQAELVAAELAVLRRDTGVLHAAAARARTLLERYFAPMDPGVTSMRETLSRMAEVELRPPLPTFGEALTLTRRLRRAAGGD